MEPIRIRVCQIFDFGTVVSIAGIDSESKNPIVVHVDHRPIKAIWNAWQGSQLPRPVLYQSDRLTLELDLKLVEPEGDGGELLAVAEG